MGQNNSLDVISENYPTPNQKKAIEEQQNIKKHTGLNFKMSDRAKSVPNFNESDMQSSAIQHQLSAPPKTIHQSLRLSNESTESRPRDRKETMSIFEASLILHPFNKYDFPLSSVNLLTNKRSEFELEFVSFLKTQSQIFDLKLEHIKIEENEWSENENEAHHKLAASIQQRINQKRNELTGKWDEFVRDQKEIQALKQKIMQKHLDLFKLQLHFENHADFVQIMKSNKISSNEKEMIRLQLRDFRDSMISKYKVFREQHYEVYDVKLKEIQIREQQKFIKQQKQPIHRQQIQ